MMQGTMSLKFVFRSQRYPQQSIMMRRMQVHKISKICGM